MTLLLLLRCHVYGTPTPPAPTTTAIRGAHATLTPTQEREALLRETTTRRATLS